MQEHTWRKENCRTNGRSEGKISDILFDGSFSHLRVMVFQIIIVIPGINMLYLLSINDKVVYFYIFRRKC